MSTGSRVCIGCGSALPPPTGGNPRKWCSEACRARVGYAKNPERRRQYYERTKVPTEPKKWCANCGDPVVNRESVKYCGKPECKKVANRIRMREYFRKVGGNKHRKPEVVKAWYESQKAAGLLPKWDDAKRARSQERRARKYAADSERFSATEVYERDGWVCGICSLPVDASLTYPNPGSPSLDHIEPLSLGGAHTRANTRLAHVRCNIVRGNRVEKPA